MEVLHPRCCGLDVHKETVVACVRRVIDGKTVKEVRTFSIPEGAAAAFNYGLDKVRFLAPVKAGARVRLRVALMDVEEKGGGLVMKTNNTLEIEGSDKPALIAESLALIMRPKGI